jgi:NAD(P)-dependent dehydrogenase (short-subunit alcohol dehydrogenase family)
MAAYNASKAAVISLTRSLALEWAELDINVNAVCPGSVDTPMLRSVAEWMVAQSGGTGDESGSDTASRLSEQADTLLQSMVPRQLGRHIQPIEVGRVVAFLLSDRARIIRGQAINVDGGDTPY